MAAPRLVLAVLFLALAAVTLTEALRGFGPKGCCYRFQKDPIPANRVLGYYETSQRCSNPALKLRMKTPGGRKVCVIPSVPWVKELVRVLDARVNIGETSPL